MLMMSDEELNPVKEAQPTNFMEPSGREEKWIKHYSSKHDILIVGDGDFSFSLCLGSSFGSATNIVATSLDSYGDLLGKYGKAKANLENLEALGASILHEVDATSMRFHPHLLCKKYHRIVYNFPHAGYRWGGESNAFVIAKHRELVQGFLREASRMLYVDGEIHITHKTAYPFSSWRIEDLASECSLLYKGETDFCIDEYPGYKNKRGSGGKADEAFPLGACATFKFGLSPGYRAF